MLVLTFLSLAIASVRCAPTGFEDPAIRMVQFPSGHVERMSIAAIERLRTATPLPRPLTSESLSQARSSLSDVPTGSGISDEAIERLQGYFHRKQWGPGFVDITADYLNKDDTPALFPRVDAPKYPILDPSRHPELQPMLDMVTSSEIKSYVEQLSTAYQTRYYRSPKARGMSDNLHSVRDV